MKRNFAFALCALKISVEIPLFGEGSRNPEAQKRFQAALKRGFQTRDAEMDLGRMLGDLGNNA